jgi:hypothetical protein
MEVQPDERCADPQSAEKADGVDTTPQAQALSPYCLSGKAWPKYHGRYGSAKKANFVMMCRPSTTTTTVATVSSMGPSVPDI